MIPTTNNLNEINPQILKTAGEFMVQLESWKEKLKDTPFLDFIVIPEIEKFKDNYQLLGKPGHYSHNNESIANFHTDEELIESVRSGLIIRAATFLLKSQWIEDNPWPECYGDDCPEFIEINFYINNEASIISSGPGLVEVNEDDVIVKDYEFSGTWSETFNHLMYIIEGAMKKMTI